VLFITADETTVLWDPNNTAPSTFEDPINQPHTMTDGYSQLCGHHVFLPDGQLLSVGGGGYGPNPAAHFGWRFEPGAKSWARSANSMSESKWYPTANILNDEKVLVTCGNTSGNMELYDIASDTFSTMTGDTKHFPNLYPGLHLLPNSVMVYSRTGWGSAGAGGFATADNTTSFFTFIGPASGIWTDIVTDTVNRAKGMSVLLYASTPPRTIRTSFSTRLSCRRSRHGARRWRFLMASIEACAALCCCPTATCSCVAVSRVSTRHAPFTIR
jgi:hypothetical protein